MARVNLGPGIVNFPMPVSLVGTSIGGKVNFMTVSWVSMVSYAPPRIAISLGHHKTSETIRAAHVFSVCFPSAKDIVTTDYCGLVSGSKTDKSAVFRVFTGLTGAPMAEECALNVECRLNYVIANGSNQTFVGDIAAVYADESILSNGKVDLAKLNPLLLSQLDTRYYTIGTVAGRAWEIGREQKAK